MSQSGIERKVAFALEKRNAETNDLLRAHEEVARHVRSTAICLEDINDPSFKADIDESAKKLKSTLRSREVLLWKKEQLSQMSTPGSDFLTNLPRTYKPLYITEAFGEYELSEEKKANIDLSINKQIDVHLRRLWAIHHEGQVFPKDANNDIAILESAIQSNICPITRAELDNPVQNQSCGHVYSRDAIEAMAKTSLHHRWKTGAFPCPVVGCVGKVCISKLHVS